MAGPQDLLTDLLADSDLLYQVLHHYVLERKDGWCDIYVYRLLNGANAGLIYAIPKLTWRSAYENYYGKGGSEDTALRDCLDKLKDMPHTCVFPPLTLNEHQEEDGPSCDPSYGDNGHLPRWY